VLIHGAVSVLVDVDDGVGAWDVVGIACDLDAQDQEVCRRTAPICENRGEVEDVTVAFSEVRNRIVTMRGEELEAIGPAVACEQIS